MSRRNGFINSHTISQLNESISCNDMNGGVGNNYSSTGSGSMAIQIIHQYNGFISLINSNNIDYILINYYFNNGDVSFVENIINICTLSQCN